MIRQNRFPPIIAQFTKCKLMYEARSKLYTTIIFKLI